MEIINRHFEKMEMPTCCQKCEGWFDLNDGVGSEKWFPRTVICYICGENEQTIIELEQDIEDLKDEINQAEDAISDANQTIVENCSKIGELIYKLLKVLEDE